jgi:hypothetical protein
VVVPFFGENINFDVQEKQKSKRKRGGGEESTTDNENEQNVYESAEAQLQPDLD